MHKQIFVNLPVKDLARSRAFFARLGFTFNEQFSNDDGACLILGENIFAMLLAERFFQTFTGKPVADASETTEVLTCLSCESRAEVDALVAKAIDAGGRAPNPKRDHGFMYGHGFEDLDGHVWELAWMDRAAPGLSAVAPQS
jgi:predicted lactoylglutathione lyase